MSRLPDISRKHLPDHASQERVDRIWSRVRDGLPTGGALSPLGRGGSAVAPKQPGRLGRSAMYFAAAAALFGVGVAVGLSGGGTQETTATSAGDAQLTDVFAAGTRQRSFSLPGGGRLVLEADSMVELVHLSDEQVTLSLLRGAATVDSATMPIDVVAGEARVSAPAGSSVALARREADVDVLVARGRVDVMSPAGHQVVSGGQVLPRVPTVAAVTSRDERHLAVVPPVPVPIAHRDPPPDPLQAHHAGPRDRDPAPAMEPVAVTAPPAVEPPAAPPSWMKLASEFNYKGAFEAIEKGPGIAAAVGKAQSARELIVLSDIASAGRKFDQKIRALHRVADDFSSDPYAAAAAAELARHYESSDKQLAAKYREKAKQAKVITETVLCTEIRALMGEDADSKQAAHKAAEYLRAFPTGACATDARTLFDEANAKLGDADKVAPAPSKDDEEPKGDAKKDDAKKDDAKKDDKAQSKGEEPKKDETAKTEEPKKSAPANSTAPAPAAPKTAPAKP